MGAVYSLYEAKARFSEVIRKVRAGQRIRIAYRGEEVAEIRPVESVEGDLERRLARLEEQGVLSGPRARRRELRPLARRRGALKRVPRGAGVILAYVDTSCLVAIAFASGAAGRLADRLSGFDRLLSSNLLEAELRSALAREGVQDGAGPLLSGMTWVHPDRPLTPEFDRVLAPGYPHPHGVAFLSLDRRQREVAARLGFTV